MSAAVSLSARWETRLRGTRPRPRRGWALPLSLGLHLAVLLLLLFGPRPAPPPEDALTSPVALIFQSPKEGRKSTPNPQPQASLPEPPPAPPPQPPAPQPKLAAPVPAPLPPVAALPPAPVVPTAPPVPTPAVPALRTATLPLPPALVAPPPAPPVAPSQPKRLAMTVPLQPPKLRPVPTPRRHTTEFPAPMIMSLGRPLRPPQPARRESRGPGARGPNSFGNSLRLLKGHVDPSWGNEFVAWVQRHAYWPPQAIAENQSGTTVVRLVVDRYGHVVSVERQMSSGSQWLDMETVGMLRGATVPPLPPDTADHTITFDFYLHWVILR